MTDRELLSTYVVRKDAHAFDTLVRRHVNWVHAMAARLLRNHSLADDVTQAAFVLLARKASSLQRETVISTWLFSVTRYCASNAMRNEIRRRKHEQNAAMQKSLETGNHSAPEWETLAPMLDECVGRLRARDRQAVLLRFYEGKTFPEIGQTLAMSEDAARKRVSRAVEQLRDLFARRGVTVGSAALSAAVVAHVAPPASAAVVVGATAAHSLAATASFSSITSGINTMLIWSGLKPAIPIVVALLVGGAAVSIFMQLPNRAQPLAVAPTTQHVPSSLPSPAAPSVKYYVGQVLDSDQKPISGARVFLLSPDASAASPISAVTSNAQGEFRLAGGQETPQILAMASGFGATGVRISIDDSAIQIRMRRPTEIHARFVTPDLKPIANARVVPLIATDTRLRWDVTFPPDLQNQLAVVSDADGNIIMPGMPQDARIQLGVMDDRFVAYHGQAGVRGTTGRGGGTARGPGSSPTPQAWAGPSPIVQAGTFRVPLAASISGRITYVDGRGAANVQVRAQVTGARGAAAPPNLSSVTDPEGLYRLMRLDSMEYDLMLSAGGGVLSAFNAPLRQRVPAVAGHDTPGTNFTLTSGATLKGRVIDQKTQRPMPGVTVGVIGPATPQTSMAFQEVLTRADGAYEAHVPPGLQRIVIQRSAAGTGPSTLPSIQVAEGEMITVPDIPIVEDPRPPVHGRVVDAEGHGVAGAVVSAGSNGIAVFNVLDDLTRGVAVFTDSDGSFVMPRVRVGMRGNMRATRGDKLGSDWVAQPATDTPVHLVIHELPSLASVRVLVSDPEGTPVPDARITLMRAVQSTAGSRTRTGAGGAPSYTYLSAGEVVITGTDGTCLIDELTTETPYMFSVGARGFADESAVVHPEAQGDVKLSMKRADSFISGIVVNETGDPMANIEVTVSSGRSVQLRSTTDAGGRFRLEGVPFAEKVNLNFREAINGAPSIANIAVDGGRDDVLVVYRTPTAPASSRP